LGRCATLYNTTRFHPVLNGLAEECCGMLARLVVNVGALALLAIVGIHLWDQLPPGESAEASTKAAWSLATRRLLSVSSIYPKKQRLARSSGTPGATARTSCAGPPRAESKAKSRSLSSISIAAATNPANRGRWPTSPPESTPAARANWRRLESSTANSRGDAASCRRPAGQCAILPRIRQTSRRTQSPDLRLDLPGRQPAGPPHPRLAVF